MTRAEVTCLDCGTEFVRPSGYAGNYCPECHESWASDTERETRPEPRRPRRETTPSIRHRDDEDADLPSRYDEE